MTVGVEVAGVRYAVKTVDDFRQQKCLVMDTAGWVEKNRTPLLTSYLRPAGVDAGTVTSVRVEAHFTAFSPAVMYDALLDCSYRAVWDDNMMEGSLLRNLDAHNAVSY